LGQSPKEKGTPLKKRGALKKLNGTDPGLSTHAGEVYKDMTGKEYTKE